MRYAIGFSQVQEGQKHDRWLFETNSLETAKSWLDMEFLVWDVSQGKPVYAECDFY